MPKYVIERLVPNAPQLEYDQLKRIAQNFCEASAKAGSQQVQWIKTIVTSERIYCVYIADTPEKVLAHVSKHKYPATLASEVTTIIDPRVL
jgi:hypothetical protein